MCNSNVQNFQTQKLKQDHEMMELRWRVSIVNDVVFFYIVTL